MTNKNNAAQAADQDPLSDEYVNAVIQQHGYQSPEAVCARLYQWIGLHGGENGVTLLIYEAHKVLSKLCTPVADDGLPDVLPEYTNESGAQFVSMATVQTVLRAARATLANSLATNQATSGGRNMFYEGLFEGETERQRDRRLKWMKTVRPASVPVAFYRQSLRDLVDVVWKEATESTAVPDTAWADRLIDKVFPSVLASAPVAGEALNDLQALQWAEKYGIQWALRTPDAIREVIADAQSLAAPQASEAVPLSQYGYQALFNAIGKAVKPVGTDQHPHIEISVEAFRAALSAQPGAQRTGGSDA